jgi:hypothetical protein
MALMLRFILPLLQLSFVFAAPQHGDSHSLSSENTEPKVVQKQPAQPAQPAPAGCKKLPIDADWPSPEVVNNELPGWEEPMPDGKMKHPNYIYEVKRVSSAQKAVRFAAKHNIRLSIINTGHDFLGR